MTTPIVAQKAPYSHEVAAGKTYYWCACGRSANQPFCDGSHKAVGMAPIAYKAEKDAHGLVLRLQAEQERAPLRRNPPEPVSGDEASGPSNRIGALSSSRETATSILRSNAEHCVSKDGPACVRASPRWSVLRDAALHAAPQDEGVWTDPDD